MVHESQIQTTAADASGVVCAECDSHVDRYQVRGYG